MNSKKAKQIAEEMQLGRYTFNAEVLSRFMTLSEIQELDKAYKGVLKSTGIGGDRFRSLSTEITEQDKKIVKDYLDDLNQTTVTQMEKQAGLSAGTLAVRAGRAALKYLYQNKINI